MIDTGAIRSKILDLAISGKLTEQLPEDGTAEELFVQIQVERKRQEKAGTIKMVDLSSGIDKEEKPFSIPINWKWTHFGDVSYIVRGGSPRPIKEYITTRQDGINWIKIGDVEKGGKYINSTHEKIIPEGESKSRRVYPGDFLLTNSMSFGRPYISQIEGCIHDGWLLIHGLGGFNPDYLYYLLSSAYMHGRFTDKASGSTVENLNIDKVKGAIIPLPPLAEQGRIVYRIEQVFSVLDTIDALQAQYSDNLTVLKSKLIDAAIQGKLTEQLPEDGTAEELYQQIQTEKQALIKAGKIKKEKPYSRSPVFNDYPFDIPNSWLFVRFGDLMINRDSERIPVSVADRRVREKIYDYYGASGVIDKIDDFLFDKDLLLIGEDGANLLARSSPIAFIASGKYWVNNHAHVLDVCGGVNLRYICLYINAISLEKYITGSAQPKMNQENMNAIWVALPPLAEQKRIVDCLDKLLSV